jgi:branched-chain amino acid transport system substrate-binding protein
VILPLSGANAQFGINSRNGIELVAEEINAAGGIKALGGAKINLVVADSTSTPTTAASVAQRLITQNEVTAILGAFASSLTIAISEVTERRDMPLSPCPSPTRSPAAASRTSSGRRQGVAIGKAQFDGTLAIAGDAGQKLEKVAIMYEDTAYGTAQAGGLRAGAKAAGVRDRHGRRLPARHHGRDAAHHKLRGSGAQAVFPVSYLNDSLLIIRTMRQQRITMPAVGGAAGYVIPDFEKGLGEFAEGVLSIAPANYDYRPELTERFRKKYGYFMVHEALEHAVCLDVLAQAIERAKSAKAEEVVKHLRGARFEGGWARGETGDARSQFDETGLNTLSVPGDGAVAQEGARHRVAAGGREGAGDVGRDA